MELTLEEITYLGRIFTNKNELGLLSNINVALKGDEEKSLAKKGVLSDGKLSLGMDEFLKTISMPERCCRFVAQVGYLTVEKYTYYKENRIVLAQNSQGNLLFSIDSDLKEIKGHLIDLYGGSNLKTITISLWLQRDELLAFAALVDLYRKEELMCYPSGGQARDSFPIDELREYIEKPTKNGLLNFLITNFKNFSSPANLETAVAELAKKSLLIRGDTIRFSQDVLLFAKNFLLIHSVSLLEILNLTGSQITISAAVFLNSSVHDVIRIQLLDNGVNLSTVTSQEQIDEILWALNCPELPQEDSSQRLCPTAGRR